MSASTTSVLLAFLSIWSLLGLALSLRMEASPNPWNQVIHKELDISCILDGQDAQSHDVVAVQIERPNEKPLVIVDTKRGLDLGPHATNRMEGEGHIDNGNRRSYVKIIIREPGSQDMGIYECSMFYRDPAFQFKEERSSINVTMDNENVESIATFFMGKLTALEKVTHQKLTALEKMNHQQLTALEKVNHQQSTRIAQLEEEIALLKTNNTRIAFSMRYEATASNKLYTGRVMKFTKTLVNMGTGYNLSDGVFTAPLPGLYVFHLVVGTSKISEINIEIRVNNNDIADVWAIDGESVEQASQSVILNLQQGDKVAPVVIRVSTPDAAYFWDSVFSGYLLYSL